MFLNELVWVFRKWEFQAGDNGLWLFLWHNVHLPSSKYFFIESVTFILVNFNTDADICFCCYAKFSTSSSSTGLKIASQPLELSTISSL